MEKKQALEDFKNNLDRIFDPDFGDFKRKCGNYITRLAPHFLDNSECFEILKDLKHYVVFNDNLRTPEEVLFYIDHKIHQIQDRIQ
jgi:hypothetical protein